jgi:hypothetical protein
MTDDLQRTPSKEEVYNLFKAVVAPPNTPDAYIHLAIEYARQLGIDPLRRQVMIIPSKDGPKIVVGINALRAVVQRNREWHSTNSAPVYKDDDFTIDSDGNVHHIMQPHKRASLERTVGAWATTIRMRHGQLKKFTIYLRTDDYRQAMSRSWQQQEPWMIAKTAEAFSIRQAFSDMVSGVYIPEEFGAETPREQMNDEVIPVQAPDTDAKLKEILSKPPPEPAGEELFCGLCGSPLEIVKSSRGLFKVCKDALKNYNDTKEKAELDGHFYRRLQQDEQKVSSGTQEGEGS